MKSYEIKNKFVTLLKIKNPQMVRKKITAKCLVILKDGDHNKVMCVIDDMGDKVLVRISGDKYMHAVFKKKDLIRLF